MPLLSRLAVLKPAPLDNINGSVGWWRFDDGTAADLSGNQNNGVYSNTPPAPIGGPVAGVAAVNWAGTNQYATITHAAMLDLAAPFTITVWLKYASQGNIVVLEKNGNSGFSFQLGANVTDALTVWVGAPNKGPQSNSTWADSKWHFFAMICGASPKVYVDGIDDTGSVAAADPPSYAGAPVYFGSRAGSFPYTGAMADVRFWPRQLAVDEIRSLYYQGIAFPGLYSEGEMPALFVSTAADVQPPRSMHQFRLRAA